MDSNGDVHAEDTGHIIVTGSHGGLLGGKPETAVKHPVFAAVYNDAGIGIDDAGISRLPVLDRTRHRRRLRLALLRPHRRRRSTLDDGYHLRAQRYRAPPRRHDRAKLQ